MKSAVVVFVSALLAGPASAGDRALERAAQAVLAEHFEEDGPGAVVALVRGGRPLVVTARGVADVDAGTPLTPASVFDLASVSKHVTATAIVVLAEDGELDLDAAVTDYVPDFAVPEKGRAVTVADLLHHVSGLADYTSDDYEDGDAAFARLTTETHLEWLNGTTARRAPGRRYEYNNSGYALLALIVERVSGESYTAFVGERLFAPAGMRRTHVLDALDKRIPGAVRGYTTKDGAPEISRVPTQITGDGNVFTSVDDLVRWCAALGDGAIVDSDALERMWTNGTYDSGAAIDADGEGYGHGWGIDEANGRVYHDGSWYGTAAFLSYDRDDDVWAIVLSNDEDADVAAIGEALFGLVE